MTRSTLYLILPDETKVSAHLIGSLNFTGSSIFGYGKTHMKELENIDNVKSFKYYLKNFNSAEGFNYSKGDKTHKSRIGISKTEHGFIINLKVQQTGYYYNRQKFHSDKFSSDWLFFKNLTTKTVGLKTKDDMLFILKPNEQVALEDGNYENHYTSIEQKIFNYL